MRNSPLVSVIIPVYNRANKVGTAIRSVLDQEYKPIQLIVVDDGSTDHTAEAVRQFPEAEYILQEHAGQGAARNNGLNHAAGTLIATLDSDDFWEPRFLSHCVPKLEDEHLDFVFANWIQESRNDNERDFLRTYAKLADFIYGKEDGWIDLSYEEARAIYLDNCPSPSSSVLLRKSSIVSGWDPRFNIADDWCMFLDIILNKKCKVAFCLQKLWRKSVDESNIYDGRNWNEVLELLYVEDFRMLLDRYRHLLTQKEIKPIERLHLECMLKLAIYKLFREFDIVKFFHLVKQSFNLDANLTLRAISKILKIRFYRKLKNTRLET